MKRNSSPYIKDPVKRISSSKSIHFSDSVALNPLNSNSLIKTNQQINQKTGGLEDKIHFRYKSSQKSIMTNQKVFFKIFIGNLFEEKYLFKTS